MDKDNIKMSLLEELRGKKIFWSFGASDQEKWSDEWLIEKVLLHSDLDSVYRLFEVYPENSIRAVWEKRLLPDKRQHSMNMLYAFLIFRIGNPESYVLSKEG